MPQSPRETLIEGLRRLADEAGRAIMAHYGKAEASRKADDSPVTVADQAAEAIILAGLAQLDPGTPVVAEESVAKGESPERVGDRFWLVDPLDGTKEFLSQNGEFTVNIALVEHVVPTVGVVLAPALRTAYWSDGTAAWASIQGGAPRAIRARPGVPSALVAAVSRSHLDKDTLRYCAEHRVKETRAAGSSLKFGLVAAGEADVYPRFGRTMEWDTAAGHAVLRAAGGSVCDLQGHELRYGKPGFANPSFIARGRDA